MTLFLLLVTIAALVPIFTIGLESLRLDAAGIVGGGALALVLGVVQFVGHHKAVAWIECRGHSERGAGWLIGAYYVVIVCGGVVCGSVVRAVARSLSSGAFLNRPLTYDARPLSENNIASSIGT